MFCIYRNFFEYLGLYTYVITAYKFETIDLYTYFYFVYLIRFYCKIYQSSIKLVLIKDLALDLNILSLKFCKLRKQLKTKRIRKNAWKRQERKCKNCG